MELSFKKFVQRFLSKTNSGKILGLERFGSIDESKQIWSKKIGLKKLLGPKRFKLFLSQIDFWIQRTYH